MTDIQVALDVIQLVLAVGAIVLTGWIALVQYKQLRQLKGIAEETANITEETSNITKKLQTDTRTQKFVKKFFSLSEGGGEKYKCVFPVYYAQRPLPLIVAGDYYALHLLQSLMGPEQLELKAIPQNLQNPQPQPNDDQSFLQGNIIFLCMPPVNPALQKLAPAVEITDPQKVATPRLGQKITLPCWFAIEKKNQRSTKKIWISDLKIVLESKAEEDYTKAATLQLWEVYSNPIRLQQSDYGILMRVSEGERKVIVMAGIHQYGTWIVGEFFRQITVGALVNGSEIFEGNDDFLVVVWGEFDSTQFSVGRCGVLQDYLWVRREDAWARMSAKNFDVVG